MISEPHDIHPIFQAGEGQWGTDESSINQVLATRNYFQLNETFAAYEKLTGHSIMEAVKKETSGSLQKGFLAVSKYFVKNISLLFRSHTAKKIGQSSTNVSLRCYTFLNGLDFVCNIMIYI